MKTMTRSILAVIVVGVDPDKIIPRSINRAPFLTKPLGLTAQEKTDLESFLRTLTDRRFVSAIPAPRPYAPAGHRPAISSLHPAPRHRATPS